MFHRITKDFMGYEGANPFRGWPYEKVIDNPRSPCGKNDIFGHLYYYVFEVLATFSEYLQRDNLSITIINGDAKKIEKLLSTLPASVPREFDFIDISNAIDNSYMKPAGALSLAGSSLLKPTGTFQGVFMDYVYFPPDNLPKPTMKHSKKDKVDEEFRTAALATAGCFASLWLYRKWDVPGDNHWAPETVKMRSFILMMFHYGKIWERYLKANSVDECAEHNCLVLKKVDSPWEIQRAEALAEGEVIIGGVTINDDEDSFGVKMGEEMERRHAVGSTGSQVVAWWGKDTGNQSED